MGAGASRGPTLSPGQGGQLPDPSYPGQLRRSAAGLRPVETSISLPACFFTSEAAPLPAAPHRQHRPASDLPRRRNVHQDCFPLSPGADVNHPCRWPGRTDLLVCQRQGPGKWRSLCSQASTCTEATREKISPPRPLGFVTIINASTEELHNAAVTTPTPTRRVIMESKLEISEQNQRRN